MVTASGWRREDAVVSEATKRLQNWVGSALWSISDTEDGTPVMARALCDVLGAHAVLLLVRTPESGWQLSAAAHSQGWSQGFDIDGAAPALSATALDEAPAEPAMRDQWSAAQVAFAEEACALLGAALQGAAGEAAAPEAGVEQAEARLVGATPPDIELDGTLATGVTMAHSVGASTFAEAASALDTNNTLADWPRTQEVAAHWYEEAPSLLLTLCPPLATSEEEGSVGRQMCGAVLAWIKSEDGSVSDEWRPLWSSCAQQAAAWVHRSLRIERVGRSYRDMAHLVARVVDARDPRRSGHGPLVAHACVLVARALGLPEREVEEWEMAGLMHGIGRVPIPDAVLQKQGALEPEERDAIRASMQEGALWLGEVEGWDNVALMVKHAGERWDGHGYPDGLAGEAVPLGSRAIAIAARFSSLSQGRSERGGLGSLHNVGTALEAEAGRALDPRLTALFLRAMRGGAR